MYDDALVAEFERAKVVILQMYHDTRYLSVPEKIGEYRQAAVTAIADAAVELDDLIEKLKELN